MWTFVAAVVPKLWIGWPISSAVGWLLPPSAAALAVLPIVESSSLDLSGDALSDLSSANGVDKSLGVIGGVDTCP